MFTNKYISFRFNIFKSIWKLIKLIKEKTKKVIMLIVFKDILIKKIIHKSNHHPQTLIIFESGTRLQKSNNQ